MRISHNSSQFIHFHHFSKLIWISIKHQLQFPFSILWKSFRAPPPTADRASSGRIQNQSQFRTSGAAMYNCIPPMRTKASLPVLSSAAVIGGALVAAVLFYTQRAAVSQTLAADDSVLSFRMRFGVTDTEPRAWDGSLTVSGGEALRIRNWRPRPGDKIEGARAWSLSTRRGLNFDRRPWE